MGKSMDPFADVRQQAARLVREMTLEEKASLLSGLDSWHTKPVHRLGIPSVMMTDGPHGLRKQNGPDHMDSGETVPATAFPTAVTTACSFDRALLREMGEAMGEECLEEDVAVLLGPGINVKRSPVCGRNFEYFSEDPFLAGETAAALIDGVQSKNVGVSLKHFLANSQEKARMVMNSVIDERALREIYLRGFEIAVKKTQPWTLMCSYNRIGGVYAADSRRFLTDIPRDEWGFQGLFVSDWGAVNDRVQGVRAGLDLEMPSSLGINDRLVIEAVRSGALEEHAVNACAERVVMLALRGSQNKKTTYDREAHHELARRIARESAVLLKNAGALPARKAAKIAVVGEFAETPRYQGSGSSRLNPSRMTSVLDAFCQQKVDFVYAPGYDISSDETDEKRLAEAVEAATTADAVFAFIGLPDRYESEGFDRTSLRLPEAHNKLIEVLMEVNQNVVAVVFAGGVVDIPWRDRVNALLFMGLSGQNGGMAAYDLLFGDVSPSGKLAETWPLRLEDTPSFAHFGTAGNVEYRESIYVGYRYYDKAHREAAYPFGFGLSYSSFEYADLRLDRKTLYGREDLLVSAMVKNTGKCEAKEIVQLYVAPPETTLFKPVRELREYEKISLQPGESREVRFTLSRSAFSYYNTQSGDWAVENGTYGIEIGASSRDIRLREVVIMASPDVPPPPDFRTSAPGYYTLTTGDIPRAQFEAVLGRPVSADIPIRPFTVNSTLSDLRSTLVGRLIARIILSLAVKTVDPFLAPALPLMLGNMPLRSFAMMSDGILTLTMAKGLADICNGKLLRGLRKLLRKK